MTGTSKLTFKFDPKNIEVRTFSVQKALEPLVMQVTTLVGLKKDRKQKKGKSKKATVLVAAVQRAVEQFTAKGEQIAREYPDFRNEMLEAVQDVRERGAIMSKEANEFALDPCSSSKRASMVDASRSLLLAVTRLLILADMVDVQLLLSSLNVVENALENITNPKNAEDLLACVKALGAGLTDLVKQAGKRQRDTRDPQLRDDLAAARAVLSKYSPMLFVASKICVNNPGIPAAKANRDYMLREVCNAVDTINDIANGKKAEAGLYSSGDIAKMLDKFEEAYKVNPAEYNKVLTKAALERQLDDIINKTKLFADSPYVANERKERIFNSCDALRQALQGLFSAYAQNVGKDERSEDLDNALDDVGQATKGLRRQMRKAVADQITDEFLETTTPLYALIEAAKSGNKNRLDGAAESFLEHAKKLVEVANLACTLSSNEEGVHLVRTASTELQKLAPEVVNAARILAAKPNDKLVQENMEAFKILWEKQLALLEDAVDDITTVDDFLSVAENLILEDVNNCLEALKSGNVEELSRLASNISGRSRRVCKVVEGEMDNYEPCTYTRRVMQAVKVVRDDILDTFEKKVDNTVAALKSNPPKDPDENEFIDASRTVFEGVREIRRAVLMNRSDDELDPDEVDVGNEQPPNVTPLPEIPEEHKVILEDKLKTFHKEKRNFDIEIGKWDETSNDIIVLAKYMCSIMLDMTDFTRGRGSLRNMMDVIAAAQKISEAGTKLDALVKPIAERCPESTTKGDLLVYLERITLYCQQLKITSKVKADVTILNENLVIADLESATSLIQSAKNLMNAVVMTVKASYVASTKFPRTGKVSSLGVVWKMKLPEKKPLVRTERTDETRKIVRRGSQRKVNPTAELSVFQLPSEIL